MEPVVHTLRIGPFKDAAIEKNAEFGQGEAELFDKGFASKIGS